MRLKIDQLQTVVRKTIKEERTADVLREEVNRVLGPIIDTNTQLNKLAESVNDRLDVLERTGREPGTFKTSVLLKLSNSNKPEVRKMVARLIPEAKLSKFLKDKSRTVRLAAAKRASFDIVKEMHKRFPRDDELFVILEQKANEVETNLTGDGVRTYDEGLELSDVWYKNKATELFKDYQHQGPIDLAWEERAVKAFCQHTKATSGVDVDQVKLYETLLQLIEDNEEDAYKRTMGADTLSESIDDIGSSNILKECAALLEESAEEDFLGTPVFPVIEESTTDPVEKIIESGITGSVLKSRFEDLFEIQKSSVPAGIKKYIIGENHDTLMIPSKGRLPHTMGLREVDERLLDLYCEAWNQDQEMSGEPFRLEWTVDPCDINSVGFTVMLK